MAVEQKNKDWVTPIAIIGGGAALVVGGWLMFKKDAVEPSFDLKQPVAVPQIITPGETTTISADLDNLYNKPVKVDVKMEIFEAGFIWNSAKKLDSKVISLTIPALGKGTATITHVGTTGGPTNSDGVNMRCIGITTLINGAQVGKPWEADDVFGVRVGQGSMGITMLNPIISPAEVPVGEICHITCPVQNVGSEAVQVRAQVRIVNVSTNTTTENGMLPASALQTIQPGATADFEFSWVAGATLGGKWIIESLYMSTGELAPYTGPNNPNTFKQPFDVIAVSLPDAIQTQSITYGNAIVGQPLKVTVVMKNTAAVRISPSFRLDIKKNEGAWTTWQEGTADYGADINPGATVTFEIDSIPIPSDWSGISTMAAQIVLYGTNGSWDYMNGITVGASTVLNPSVIINTPQVAYGGQVHYTFLDFQPNSQIYATVSGQGGAIDFPQSDADGNGSSYFLGYLDPGGYILNVRDDYGHSAVAAFAIGAVGPSLSASWNAGVVTYGFSGFPGHVQITITVVETGGYLYHWSNGNGTGDGTFGDTDAPGTYTLRATQGLLTATATFTIR